MQWHWGTVALLRGISVPLRGRRVGHDRQAWLMFAYLAARRQVPAPLFADLTAVEAKGFESLVLQRMRRTGMQVRDYSTVMAVIQQSKFTGAYSDRRTSPIVSTARVPGFENAVGCLPDQRQLGEQLRELTRTVEHLTTVSEQGGVRAWRPRRMV